MAQFDSMDKHDKHLQFGFITFEVATFYYIGIHMCVHVPVCMCLCVCVCVCACMCLYMF